MVGSDHPTWGSNDVQKSGYGASCIARMSKRCVKEERVKRTLATVGPPSLMNECMSSESFVAARGFDGEGAGFVRNFCIARDGKIHSFGGELPVGSDPASDPSDSTLAVLLSPELLVDASGSKTQAV
jgi:hypothetical protein